MITENNYCLVNNISLENTMTIRELSKLINVSPATISIVINEKKGVSEETREKVLAAMKEYNYYPQQRKRITENKNVLVLKHTEAVFLLKKIKGL